MICKASFRARTACRIVCAWKMHCDCQEGPQTCEDFALFTYVLCNLKEERCRQKRTGLKVLMSEARLALSSFL